MKTFLLGMACLLSACLALADGSSYSLDIDVAPATDANGFVCKAVVKDIETGKILTAPNIRFLADSPASITTTEGELSAEFRVSFDSKAARATAELKVSRAGKVVAAQKTSVAIH